MHELEPIPNGMIPMHEPHSMGDLPMDPLAAVYSMPMRLVLETAVIDFTVRTLMMLEPGSIVETTAQQNEDLMLHVNGQAVGMVKFDVSGDNLAVRLTGVA